MKSQWMDPLGTMNICADFMLIHPVVIKIFQLVQSGRALTLPCQRPAADTAENCSKSAFKCEKKVLVASYAEKKMNPRSTEKGCGLF